MGRDSCQKLELIRQIIFQSTLPAWGETADSFKTFNMGHISIHSPRMGRDPLLRVFAALVEHFNPLSPHGERLFVLERTKNKEDFNPLSPHGERLGLVLITSKMYISIHSPRMGRDKRRNRSTSCASDFNPLSPHGERLVLFLVNLLYILQFQSTLPAWGETRRCTRL